MRNGPPIFTPLRLTALLALGLAGSVPGPATAQEVEWGAGIRPRFEIRGVDGGSTTAFTSMRTRVDLGRSLSPELRLFVQLQDVRLWGDEISVADGSADQIDIHQAYFELGERGSSTLFAKVGRQEAEWAEGRLVGMPVWSQVGNAYDGITGSIRLGEAGVLDLFGYQLREAESEQHDRDDTFYGAWGEFPVGEHSFQPFALLDHQGVEDGTERFTVGAYYLGATRGVTYRVEGAVQRGDLAGRDLSADMVAAQVTLPVTERVDATLWYDRYSGDAAALEEDGVPTGAFDDLFGRNHRFFGFADLFADIPTETRGRGIQDLALKVAYDLGPAGVVGADLHRFLVADDAGLDDGTLLDELDLWLSVEALSGLDLLGGVSLVSAGTAGTELGVLSADQVFGYLMVEALF